MKRRYSMTFAFRFWAGKCARPRRSTIARFELMEAPCARQTRSPVARQLLPENQNCRYHAPWRPERSRRRRGGVLAPRSGRNALKRQEAAKRAVSPGYADQGLSPAETKPAVSFWFRFVSLRFVSFRLGFVGLRFVSLASASRSGTAATRRTSRGGSCHPAAPAASAATKIASTTKTNRSLAIATVSLAERSRRQTWPTAAAP